MPLRLVWDLASVASSESAFRRSDRELCALVSVREVRDLWILTDATDDDRFVYSVHFLTFIYFVFTITLYLCSHETAVRCLRVCYAGR